MASDHTTRPLVVRGTEILPTDSRRRYREKIARITLDSMVQFVGLLDAHGTVLEINKVALDAVGIALAEVEGKPFWTTFWWQVSDEINQGIRDSIARAAKGEFVRWDTEIYGRAGGKETIIIDARARGGAIDCRHRLRTGVGSPANAGSGLPPPSVKPVDVDAIEATLTTRGSRNPVTDA